MERSGKRLGWLDFGKAMGILVVLIVHTGCKWGAVTFYGGMFYMPIFFVAAGYTYRVKEGESYMQFVRKKAARLLVPYFGASAFLWFFFWMKDSVLGGNPADLKLFSVMGIFYSRNQMYTSAYQGENPVLLDLLNAPLWFLTAMFLTCVFYDAVSRCKRKYVKVTLLAAGLLLSAAWHYSTKLLLPWSLDAIPYFSCFFAAGELLRKKDGISFLKQKPAISILIAAAFLLLSLANGSVNLSCGIYGNSMILYLAVGILGSVLVFAAGVFLESFCPRIVQVTDWIGQETLTILCFHMFLYMWIGAAAGFFSLPAGVVQAAQITGSVALLAGIKRIRKLPRR